MPAFINHFPHVLPDGPPSLTNSTAIRVQNVTSSRKWVSPRHAGGLWYKIQRERRIFGLGAPTDRPRMALSQTLLPYVRSWQRRASRLTRPRASTRTAVFTKDRGLRVADTSILPSVPLRGLAATAVLIGEAVAAFMEAGI